MWNKGEAGEKCCGLVRAEAVLSDSTGMEHFCHHRSSAVQHRSGFGLESQTDFDLAASLANSVKLGNLVLFISLSFLICKTGLIKIFPNRRASLLPKIWLFFLFRHPVKPHFQPCLQVSLVVWLSSSHWNIGNNENMFSAKISRDNRLHIFPSSACWCRQQGPKVWMSHETEATWVVEALHGGGEDAN